VPEEVRVKPDAGDPVRDEPCVLPRCKRSAWRNVLHLECDDIAPAQLAFDGEIEHRQITGPPVDLQFGADRPNVLRSQRRLRSDQLALVPRLALGRDWNVVLVGLAWSSS
jgi:hypothetical protein